MLAVPPAVLKTLGLVTDSEVGLTIDNGRLIIEPQNRPRYSLEKAARAVRSAHRHER